MSFSETQVNLATVADALLALGREERVVIDEGRLEDLVPLAERRGQLVRALDACFDSGTPVSTEVRDTLRTVRLEGQENLTRLRLAQADITSQVSETDTTGRAITGYGRASRY